MLAAGIVGGGTAIATGDLKKGIMAGLGAYGGAGLGAGLAAQGAQGAAAASTGSGVGLNAANAGTGVGVNAANAGAGVGLKAQTVFGPNVASTGTGYAGFQNPVLDAGFKNVVPTTTATSTIPTVTNASAYSPASSFNVGQNLSGVGTTAPAAAPINTMSVADKQAMVGNQIGGFDATSGVAKAYRPPSLLDLQAGARQSYPDLSTLKYGGSYGTAPGGRYFIDNPSVASNASKVARYTPSTATTSQPFAGGMTYSPSASTAADVSGQTVSSPFRDRLSQMGRGLEASTKDFEGLKGLYNAMPTGSVIASGISLADAMKPEPIEPKKDKSLIRPYDFTYGSTEVADQPYTGSGERVYFNPTFTARTPYEAPGAEYAASGGLMGYAVGGPIEQMAAMNSVGANTGYPQAGLQTPMYSNPAMQRPQAANVIAPSADAGVNTYSGEARFAEGGLSAAQRREYGISTRGQRASRNLTAAYEEMEAERQKEAMRLFGERSDPGIVPRSRTQMMSSPFSAAMAEHARLGKKSKVPVVEMPKTNLGDIDNYMDIPIEAAGGGIMHGLGGYSDGGRLLRGPGDGVSDSIPAVIGKRQPARLADGEFVIPARIVSELGNGSTEAGARKLYAMMERVQANRKKSIGKKKVAVNSKSDKHLPA
jgi:hypothetical protein